ncbi:hypothetical protein OPKNFCMD_0418 [Methylobacterium crusticola]|uniref:MucR family transcriptional regulator n=2 Tax=Methylobacterium crusticola TaxID=1697972 RepID=A0ABQ4QQX8_9HYPH|nr:MucR family transcriptional regulator [Methylobacterium crusticola]GJD47708.1 hypothetical protein OPKNFCMD_0418 [Methylobacterium crusticola]
MDDSSKHPDRIVTLTADIISAYVSSNHIQSAELPKLIADVFNALREMAISGGKPAADPAPPKATPAEIRRSVTHDFLISFEDGKSYKTLRRHLTLRGLTPEAYRQKWGLPHDYPMTSASYSEQRSELARALGLGQQRRRSLVRPAAVEGGDAAETGPPDRVEAPAGGEAADAVGEASPAEKPRRGGRRLGREG